MYPHQSGDGRESYSTQTPPRTQRNTESGSPSNLGVAQFRQAARQWSIPFIAILLLGAPAAWSGDPPSTAPVRVTVEPLAAVAVTLREAVPATVVSLNRTRVPSQIAGVIESIAVVAGEVVDGGDTLVTLDCTEPRQNLARSEAQLQALQARRQLADQQLQRAIRLLPTRNISEEQANQRRAEFDAVQAEISAQRVQIAIAGRQVEHCTIRSPYSGVVIERLASLGEYASPGTPVVEVLDTSELEVSARVPLESARDLSERSPMFSAAGRQYPLNLRTLLPLVDESSRSREARLTFSSTSTFVGTPGQVVWIKTDRAIPAHLLVSHGGHNGVFIAEQRVARFVELPGALHGRPAITDLDPSTLIVTDGRHLLEPGSPIDIAP